MPIVMSTSHIDCIKSVNAQLSSLVVKNDEKVDKSRVYDLISCIIVDIFEWYGKDISINLINGLSKTIYDNYYWLKLPELKLFAEKIKGGYFGKEFHKLSPAIIMEHLNQFANDSLSIREESALIDHDKFTHNEKYDRSFEQTKEALSFHDAQLRAFKEGMSK